MKKILLTIFSLCALTVSAQTLQFHKDGKFKIVQFTDVHWTPGNPNNEASAENMNYILDTEHPDLVIYTGDVISGKPAAEALDAALEPVVKRGIPFAVTWGNHDDEQDMTRRQLFDYIAPKPGNLTQTVEGISGVTNFVLPVLSSDGKKRQAATLYVLDSNAYSQVTGIEGYDWIRGDQIEWFRQQSRRIKEENGGDTIPALAFFHIPVPEYTQAASDVNAKLVGTRMEKCCDPIVNSGFFTAMRESGDVMGTFVGHDHDNDYAVNWLGILLCYGRFTGSKTTYFDIPSGNGARVIELTEGAHTFTTWVRLHSGEVINTIYYDAAAFAKKPY